MKQKHFAIMALTAFVAFFSSCEKEDTRSDFEKAASEYMGKYNMTMALWASDYVDFNGDGIDTRNLLEEYESMSGYDQSLNSAQISFVSDKGDEFILVKAQLPLPKYVKVGDTYVVDSVVYMPVELRMNTLDDQPSIGEMHESEEMDFGVVDYVWIDNLTSHTVIKVHVKLIDFMGYEIESYISYHFEKKK